MALRQAARNSGVEKRRLEHAADLVLAVDDSNIAPGKFTVVFSSIAPEILQQPVRLRLLIGKTHCSDRERRVVGGPLRAAIGKECCVQRDELARGVEEDPWTTMDVFQPPDRNRVEFVAQLL